MKGSDLMPNLNTEIFRSMLPKIDAALLHSSVLLMCNAGEWLYLMASVSLLDKTGKAWCLNWLWQGPGRRGTPCPSLAPHGTAPAPHSPLHSHPQESQPQQLPASRTRNWSFDSCPPQQLLDSCSRARPPRHLSVRGSTMSGPKPAATSQEKGAAAACAAQSLHGCSDHPLRAKAAAASFSCSTGLRAGVYSTSASAGQQQQQHKAASIR